MSLHAQVPPRSTDREYDALARHYDAFTAHPHYAEWVGSLEALARRHGLRGRRALDLGCGTGSARCHSWSSATTSSGAMRRPGWSPRRSTSWRARRGDLQRALAAAAARLAPGGVLLFDANTLATYATFFSRTHARETEALMMVWVGNGDESPRPGAMPCARLEVFERTSGRAWRRTTSRHRQRHHAATTCAPRWPARDCGCWPSTGRPRTARSRTTSTSVATSRRSTSPPTMTARGGEPPRCGSRSSAARSSRSCPSARAAEVRATSRRSRPGTARSTCCAEAPRRTS
jgi:hypothetical protein